MSEVDAVVVMNVCLRLLTVAELVVVTGLDNDDAEVLVATIPDGVAVLGGCVSVDGEVVDGGIGAGLDFVATTKSD